MKTLTEMPVDASGRTIERGDRLQIEGREDEALVVDGFVTLPTYRCETAGRSCVMTRPDLWHVVGE